MSQSQNPPQLNRRLIIQICIVFLLLVVTAFSAYQTLDQSNQKDSIQSAFSENLRAVEQIPLSGEIGDINAEISGMTWYEDYLILLPQYPHRLDKTNSGNLYAISKSDILSFLDGQTKAPIKSIPIPINSQIYEGVIKGFEGFEAIAFHGSQAYLTIEASNPMRGYLVTGIMDSNLDSVQLDPNIVEIPAQTKIGNFADEAIVIFEDKIYTFYEANGIYENPQPLVHIYDLTLRPLGTAKGPNLEYRLTDASTPDLQGNFWVINYFFVGDLFKIHPGPDQFSPGKSRVNLGSPPIERLFQLKIAGERIIIGDHQPLRLNNAEDGSARNWEALVILDDRGFLIATDKYPDTILAFIQR